MNVSANISAGVYDVPLDKIPDDPKERKAVLADYHRLCSMRETQFKADLEEQFGTAGNPKADALYRIAWELGHASGYSDVLSYYSDLAELIL